MSALIQTNRTFLRQWLPWVDEEHCPHDSAKVIDVWRRCFSEGAEFSVGIIYEGALIGIIGYHGFDQLNRITSIGYWLIESKTGKGIMTRSVRALIDYAINERNMNRVSIRCATKNTASRAIPERLGFIHEGTQREAEWLYDHFVDLELYSILASEWNSTET